MVINLKEKRVIIYNIQYTIQRSFFFRKYCRERFYYYTQIFEMEYTFLLFFLEGNFNRMSSCSNVFDNIQLQ